MTGRASARLPLCTPRSRRQILSHSTTCTSVYGDRCCRAELFFVLFFRPWGFPDTLRCTRELGLPKRAVPSPIGIGAAHLARRVMRIRSAGVAAHAERARWTQLACVTGMCVQRHSDYAMHSEATDTASVWASALISSAASHCSGCSGTRRQRSLSTPMRTCSTTIWTPSRSLWIAGTHVQVWPKCGHGGQRMSASKHQKQC